MPKITFYGGAQEVTGSCFLFESDNAKILIDCGMFQCPKECAERNFEPFTFSVKEIDALFITHAHLDHVGRIPKLVEEGFKGKIYSTPPTRDLAELNLKDSISLMERGATEEEKMMYKPEDLAKAMGIWEGLEYKKEIKIGDLKIKLHDAGHILGSSIVEIEHNNKKIYITGDLGNPPTPLLRSTYIVRDADYIVMEGIYGDREHEGKMERRLKLERVIEDTVKAGGVLMIPAFSLERTQELLFELNDLVENGRIPQIPVFLDSPLAIRMTEVYRKYDEYFNKEAEYLIASGDKIFKFPGLKFTLKTEESKAINNVSPPKIIIAGSGMSTGGRILHHERRYLSDPKSTLLLIGYQATRSMGREIQEGAKSVKIFGENVPVRARITTISGYSAHPDNEGLFRFVENSADTLKKVFVAQAEPKSALFLVQRIRDYLGINAVSPKYGDSYMLE